MSYVRRSGVLCALRSIQIRIGIPFSCSLCSGQRLKHCSLDCRHTFCGPCAAYWFARHNTNTCPQCRSASLAYPQPDFALRDTLQMIYSAMGRETSGREDFNPDVFVQVYGMLAECGKTHFTPRQLNDYWAPMLTAIRRMRGVPEPTESPREGPHEVDDHMEGVAEDSDWELGSGVGSEEGESEAGETG